jgi:TolA-binding protein
MRAAVLTLGILLSAPYQCATEPNERPTEDSAPKALWMLAERFEREHNGAARETTMRQLIEQYPSSRYAERARQALGLSSAPNPDQNLGGY